jgi:hypothetical protein
MRDTGCSDTIKDMRDALSALGGKECVRTCVCRSQAGRNSSAAPLLSAAYPPEAATAAEKHHFGKAAERENTPIIE